MVQLAVFVMVLVAVYALKAVAISRTHDDLARNSASFSWASMREQDEARASAWAEEEAASAERRAVVRPATALRHAGA